MRYFGLILSGNYDVWKVDTSGNFVSVLKLSYGKMK